MQSINKFTIQTHDGRYEDRPRKSALYFEGELLRTKVPGYFIELQFELPDYYLLLMTWDSPFEECYEVIIISKSFKIVGSYSFIPPYFNSYELNTINSVMPHCYELVFNESKTFRLTVNYPRTSIFKRVVEVESLT